jgi:pentatricopeptide repeat protein
MHSPFSVIGRRFDDFVYSGAIKLLGGGAEAYGHLAGRYESLGWFEEAIETFKKAITLRPHQAVFPFKVARLLMRLERYEDARAYCEKTIEVDKDYSEAYVLQGTLHRKAGDQLKALESFRKAMSYPLQDAASYNTIAKAFAESELYEEAVHAYREIVRISPRNVSAYGVMAETYAKLKRFPEALEAYRQAVELKPSADAYGILASAYARAGQYREAVTAYQQAMKLEPGFAQGWNRLSEIYIKLEDFEKRAAAGSLDEANQSIYAKLRQEQAALENFKETIRQQPHAPEAYVQMGKLYLELRLPIKAMEFLKHAARLKRSDSVIHRLRGQAQMQQGDLDEARRSFELALHLKKNDAEAWSALGELLSRQGKQDASVKAYKEALRWKPQDAAMHRQMGDLLRRMGRFAESSRSYWQAIHLNPQDAQARYGLGLNYVRLNQRTYALEQKAILKTIDAKLAAELDHMIWRLTRTSRIKD